jgi:hypothetical protein
VTSRPEPNPGRIIESLRDFGWTVAGHKTGVYMRLAWPDTTNRSLLIPLDQTAPEYEELLHAAIRQLEAAAVTGQAATKALAAYRPDLYNQHA